SPARSLVLFCLAQAMLAAVGMEWLLRAVTRRWAEVVRPLGIALAVTAVLALLLHWVALSSLPATLGDVSSAMATIAIPALVRALVYAALAPLSLVLMAWLFRENRVWQRSAALSGAAVAVVGGGLVLLGGAYNPTTAREMAYPETPLTRALRGADGRVATVNREWSLEQAPRAVLPPNASLAYGWRDAQGYDSLYLNNYRRLANAAAPPGARGERDASPSVNGNIVFIKDPTSLLLPLFAARYVVSEAPLQAPALLPAPGFPAGPPYVYENRLALPEAYTVSDWFAADDEAALEELRSRGPSALASVAAVAPGQPSPSPSEPRGAMPGGRAVVERRAPGRLVARAEPAVLSLLVLAEGYTPGWRATARAGGAAREVPVVRVNTAFQGVFVGPGPVTVEWRYEPASFRTGLFLALLAVAGVLAFVVSGKRGGRMKAEG
ncbi:MAG TPA: hypothetical protein VK689_20245, partial [Armatimonadota bacterium]|nr:hypothetical protein [Armatimonadota bacterium]